MPPASNHETADPVAPADKLSVIIMNWARPDNVTLFVGQYANMKRVGEIIVWDSSQNHPLTDEQDTQPLENSSTKVTYVRASADLGLYPRYAMAAVAKNPGVLIVDDDIELPEATVNQLHDHWLNNVNLVHGIFGRAPTADGSYTPDTVFGSTEIVLTRALVVGRFQCGLALAHGSRIIDQLPGTPKGNGEDIVLSYAAMAHSGRLNRAYKLPFRNVSYNGPEAISVRWKGHGAHRAQIVRWCRSTLLGGQILQS